MATWAAPSYSVPLRLLDICFVNAALQASSLKDKPCTNNFNLEAAFVKSEENYSRNGEHTHLRIRFVNNEVKQCPLTCLYCREFKYGESPANTTVLQGMWIPRAKVPVAATT